MCIATSDVMAVSVTLKRPPLLFTVERRRRDKINNWIVTLSKIIPDCTMDSSKTGAVSRPASDGRDEVSRAEVGGATASCQSLSALT